MSATHHDFVRRGLTARQLHFWTSRGYLHADNPNCGTGRTQTWSWSEVRIAELMVRLIAAGVTVETAAWVARHPVEGAAALRELADAVEGAVAPA